MVLALVAAALIFWRRCWRMTWRRCFVIRDGGCRLAHALWIARARLHNWSTMRLPRSISEPLGEVQKCGPICRGPIIGWLTHVYLPAPPLFFTTSVHAFRKDFVQLAATCCARRPRRIPWMRLL